MIFSLFLLLQINFASMQLTEKKSRHKKNLRRSHFEGVYAQVALSEHLTSVEARINGFQVCSIISAPEEVTRLTWNVFLNQTIFFSPHRLITSCPLLWTQPSSMHSPPLQKLLLNMVSFFCPSYSSSPYVDISLSTHCTHTCLLSPPPPSSLFLSLHIVLSPIAPLLHSSPHIVHSLIN